MKCEYCDGQTKTKQVTKPHWLKGKLYIIEDVEAEVCQECGERYYHIRVLKAINQRLQAEHEVKERLSVEVVSMA